MDQENLINEVEDKILDSLPFEAIEKLAKMADDGENDADKVNAVLKEYGVDSVEIAKSVAEKENNDGQ